MLLSDGFPASVVPIYWSEASCRSQRADSDTMQAHNQFTLTSKHQPSLNVCEPTQCITQLLEGQLPFGSEKVPAGMRRRQHFVLFRQLMPCREPVHFSPKNYTKAVLICIELFQFITGCGKSSCLRRRTVNRGQYLLA